MVGNFDHIQVVLNDHHGIAGIHQGFQHIGQLVYIGHMEPGSGLIQNVDGPAGVAFGQFRGQFDPLGFAARQGGGGLADLDISQTHIV